ncbi:MAG: phage baseplate assembly protein V [Haloferacaceae archaeon]
MSPPPGGDGAMPGVSVAVVSDNQDPDGLGRVRVTYPWRATDDVSYWARVAVPMAGPDAGTYFLPEEGDEVLVAFENGDLEHPYVVGALWNGKREPPETNSDGNNDVRTVRSRSGHELTFDDASDGGGITIETSGGHTVTLEDTSGSEKVTVEDGSGQNSLTFDPNAGEVSLEAGGTLSVEAPNIEISGQGGVKIESGGMLTLEGALIKIN